MDDDSKPPKIRKDGAGDGRGQSEGSRANRFTSGDGRNRPGRKKGAKDEKTILLKTRDMKVWIGTGDQRRSTTARHAVLLSQLKKALAGDTKAAEFLSKRWDRHETPSTEPDVTKALLEEDAAILADAAARGLTIGAVPEDHDESGSDT